MLDARDTWKAVSRDANIGRDRTGDEGAYVASEEAADAAGVERASGVGKPKSTAEVEQRVEAIGHILYGVGRGR